MENVKKLISQYFYILSLKIKIHQSKIKWKTGDRRSRLILVSCHYPIINLTGTMVWKQISSVFGRNPDTVIFLIKAAASKNPILEPSLSFILSYFYLIWQHCQATLMSFHFHYFIVIVKHRYRNVESRLDQCY